MDKPELWKIIRLNKEQDDFDAFGVVDPQGRVTDGFTSHVTALMHALECANAELAGVIRERDEARSSGAHKAGEIFALREIAAKVGTVGVTYHAVTQEVLRWKAERDEAQRHAKVLAKWSQYLRRELERSDELGPVFANPEINAANDYVKGLKP